MAQPMSNTESPYGFPLSRVSRLAMYSTSLSIKVANYEKTLKSNVQDANSIVQSIS
jgi:hypothetical protein